MSDVGALAAGETPDPNLANDAFDTLNDMLDQWSNQKQMVFYVTEIVHLIAGGGTYQYTLGAGGNIGSVFTGSVAADVLTVTAVTSGAITQGQQLSGSGITAGTQITNFITGAGSVNTAVGTYRLNKSMTAGSTTITGSYQRPQRINSAFVRVQATVGNPDYPVAVLSVEDYEMIGIKTINGPWPKALYYQPSDPLGNITYWPVPGACEVHMFADTLLQQFVTLQDTIVLPPGYKMAMRWNLSELLLPSYGKNDQTHITMIKEFAANGRAYIKRTNMQPLQMARFPAEIVSGRRKDAGWILSGGWNN